jgi:hypothetical protein
MLALTGLLLAGCAPASTSPAEVAAPVAVRASRPLDLPSPVPGSKEIVHPSVVAFEQPWNGYRYWMAATPYPFSDNAHENPTVFASHDGKGWVVPLGAANPLFTPPPGHYYSDPDLVIDADGSRLHLVWRRTRSGFNGVDLLLHSSSTDGVTWTSPRVSLDFTAHGERGASPAVVWDGHQYRLWYCAFASRGQPVRVRTAPSLDGPWSEPSTTHTGAFPRGQVPWHLDVIRVSDGYRMLLNTGRPASSSGMELWFLGSSDGLTWRRAPEPLMAVTRGKWDASLYRASFLAFEENGRRRYRIWYGSASGSLGWRIGLTEANGDVLP